METKKKVLIGVGLLSLVVGGYALAKFLTRNTVHYKYITVNYQDIPTKDLTTSEGDN